MTHEQIQTSWSELTEAQQHQIFASFDSSDYGDRG